VLAKVIAHLVPHFAVRTSGVMRAGGEAESSGIVMGIG
jgi:hypothetical protein